MRAGGYWAWGVRRRLAGGLVLLALLVSLGGGALAAWAGARRTATADERLLAASAPPDLFVFAADEKTFEEVTSGPEVEAVSGFGQLGLQPAGIPCDDDPSSYFQVRYPVSNPPFATPKPRLVRGRFADPSAAGEAVISEQHARRLGVGVGDHISYRPFLMDDETGEAVGCGEHEVAEVEVVGVIREFFEIGSGDEPTLASTYLTPAFAAAHLDLAPLGIGGMVRVVPGADASAFVDRLTSSPPVDESGEPLAGAVVSELPGPLGPPLDALAVGLVVLAAVLGVTTVVTASIAIDRQIGRSADDLRVLSALGISRRAAAIAVAMPTVAAILAGLAGAVALAAGLSRIHLLGLARTVEPAPGFDLDPVVLAIGLSVGAATLLGVAFASAFATAARAGRALPQQARAVGGFERLGRLGRLPWAVIGLRLAFGPARGGRSAPTRAAALALAIATSGVVSVLWFGVGVRHASTEPAVYGWGDWSGFAAPSDERADQEDALRSTLLVDPDVEQVADVSLRFKLPLEGEAISGVAVDSVRGRSGPTVVTGRLPSGAGEIALGPDVADRLGVGVGGQVQAGGPRGPSALRVVGLVVLPSIDGGPIGHGWVADEAAVRALGWGPGCNDDEECFTSTAISIRGGADPDAVAARLAEHGIAFEPPESPRESVLVSEAGQVPMYAAAAFAVVAAAGLAHALTATVSRRRRDLATTRALGIDRRGVGGMIVVEALVLGAAGAALGIVPGVIAGRTAWRAAARAIGIGPALQAPVWTTALVAGAVVVLALLISVLPALFATRLEPADALRAGG